MILFIPRHPAATLDHMGYIPSFLNEHDPRPACEQINERYNCGGGWEAQPLYEMLPGEQLKYPDDPPLEPLCELRLRNERIVLYQHEVVAIIQPDGMFEVCRLD